MPFQFKWLVLATLQFFCTGAISSLLSIKLLSFLLYWKQTCIFFSRFGFFIGTPINHQFVFHIFCIRVANPQSLFSSDKILKPFDSKVLLIIYLPFLNTGTYQQATYTKEIHSRYLPPSCPKK